MALIKCPECNKEISDKAVNCPNCGYPICTESNKVVPSESETENVIIRGRDKIIETDGENVLISQKEKVLYNGPIYKLEV